MQGYETKGDRVAKDDWLPRRNAGMACSPLSWPLSLLASLYFFSLATLISPDLQPLCRRENVFPLLDGSATVGVLKTKSRDVHPAAT
jgi:hypothetical protein